VVHLLLGMIKPEAEGIAGNLSVVNPQRLYGCPPNIVCGQSQLLDGMQVILHDYFCSAWWLHFLMALFYRSSTFGFTSCS